MASTATLKIQVEANTRDLDTLKRKLGDTQKKAKSFRLEMGSMRQALGALAGVAGLGLAAKKMFEFGSAVDETASKFRTVFGPASNEMQQFVDEFSRLAGLTTEEAQEITATTGAIVQGMGIAQEASAEFAEEVVRLSADLASFNNIPIAETSRAIQSGITGETESLKRLGIVIRQESVAKRAFEQTGKTLVSQLTQEERAIATLSLITSQAGVALGDLARTEESAANMAVRVKRDFRQLRDDISSAFLPILVQLVEGLEDNEGMFDAVAEAAARFSRVLLVGITTIQTMGIDAALLTGKLSVLQAKLQTFDESIADKLRAPFVGVAAILNDITRTLTGLTEEDIGEAFQFQSAADQLAAAEAQLVLLQNAARELKEELINNLAVALSRVGKGSSETAAGTSQAALTMREMHLAIVPVGGAFGELVGPVTAARAALASFNDEANETVSIASRLGQLGGIVGSLGALGIGLGPIGGVLGLGSSVFGLFDGGGTIPAGRTGIVGERGPELVSGPANVTSRADTAAMMGGDTVVNIIIEQAGIEVRRITKKQKRNENLGLTHRLQLPAAVV